MKRLYDLVNCKNDQHRIAFYYAMRDTVVAQVRVHCCLACTPCGPFLVGTSTVAPNSCF